MAEALAVGRQRKHPSKLQSVSELKVTVGNLADVSKALHSCTVPLCSISVPNLLLFHWNKQKYTGESDAPFCYIPIINDHITDGIISVNGLRRDCP